MTELYKLADAVGFSDKLHAISMGQDQGDIAYNAILEAQDKGTWVCLQNCHLCVSWMPTLERVCEELSPDRVHANFRLWLTSEPSPHFPPFVLQNGVKMTNEPPKGMRANLMGSYHSIDASFFDGCTNPVPFKKLLFGLCFFHATVRERSKFGSLGFNISYVFSSADLRISMDQLRIFLDELEPIGNAPIEIPYAALRYLVGECNYGGRVTDSMDRRCLVNILSDFYDTSIVNEREHRFSPSGMYFVPAPEDGAEADEGGRLEDYTAYIRSLPHTEGPEVFGLHDNANISCAISETNMLLSSALSLQPRSSGVAGKSHEETMGAMATDIEERLPAQFDIEKALIDFPVKYEESMNTVLTQELLRFNRLTATMKRSLVDLRRAIKGLVLMSADLEAMGRSVALGRVPLVWTSVAYPSLKPCGPWVADLLKRLAFFQAWLDAGTAPNTFWISGFFFTQAFITGTLQNYARKYGQPIDMVAFDHAVLRPAEQRAAELRKVADGVIVWGLFIEGARWDADSHVLAESRARELFTPMPFLHLLPKLKSEIAAVRGQPDLYTGEMHGTKHIYQCPVYKTSVRQGVLSTTGHSTNFVLCVLLPMARDDTQKFMIKRGIACLCSLDEGPTSTICSRRK